MKQDSDLGLPAGSAGASPSKSRMSRPLAVVASAGLALLLFCTRTTHLSPRGCHTRAAHKVGDIKWSPAAECNPGTECGFVTVPKDYFDADAGTASIAISRLNATKSPRKGTVFMNPGGPGGSGTRLASQEFADIIGHDWDLLGFDPRGINKTTPNVKCFSTSEDYNGFVANTVLEQGFTVLPESNLTLTGRDAEAHLVEQAKEFQALKKTIGEVCARNMGDELKYMGTATVVRDMDFMAQLFDGEDAKINYWGASYGSILGAYLVNMLPDRVGYVVIDGIADPVSWSTEPSHKWPANWVASSEETYRFYLEMCSKAGPPGCPLAKYTDEPAEKIMARLDAFFDDLAAAPLPVPFGNARPGFLTAGAARAMMLAYIERPKQWAESARAFAEALAGNGTLLFDKLVATNTAYAPHYDLVRMGVTCLDSVEADPTPEDLAKELLRATNEVSPHFGAGVSVGEQDGGCEFWPVRGKGPERFSGPWNATLDWPMLIVSNTMDPITPIHSGLRINSLMPHSSRLIIQDGPGHCSTAIATPCTQKLVRDYYAGILPANGTTCSTAYDYFPAPNVTFSISETGETEEDKVLKDSIRVVGQLLEEARRG